MSNILDMNEYRARMREARRESNPKTPEEAVLLAAYAVAEKEADALKVQFDKVLEGVKAGEMTTICSSKKVDK